MNIAYLLTGGNIGDRKQTLMSAKNAIAKDCGTLLRESAIYETAAWGITDQDKFLNQALQIETPLEAEALLTCLLKIEQTLGRKRAIKYGPRTIDIDILLFNDGIINTDNLKIPHPQLQNRRFALQCLTDIAPQKIHPVLKKNISQLLAECSDTLEVYKF